MAKLRATTEEIATRSTSKHNRLDA